MLNLITLKSKVAALKAVRDVLLTEEELKRILRSNGFRYKPCDNKWVERSIFLPIRKTRFLKGIIIRIEYGKSYFEGEDGYLIDVEVYKKIKRG